MGFFRVASVVAATAALLPTPSLSKELATRSGILPWVDPDTPADRQVYQSSRGDDWELVMSDEFNTPDRSFKPGEDHLWTSLEKPDGVNAALEVYSHNMTTTKCDTDNSGKKTCYLAITADEDPSSITVWNGYANPPGFKTVTFQYRAAMIQSWNKFCYQGGMLEARVLLPGATSPEAGNPDMKKDMSAHATSTAYYPTWPGIWMMGNLGRALYMASTNRMWPYSYDECNEVAFNSSNQRISACNKNPGYGLNPNQGRGAPEIDLLEAYGNGISSSIQIGPGMPPAFRTFPMQGEVYDCIYLSTCNTPGANHPDVPTNMYETKRGHKSWYQGFRFGANSFCKPDEPRKQSYEAIKASLDKGISLNKCTPEVCSASQDPHADLSLMPGSKTERWGINSNATCYPLLNGYYGGFLCSPGKQDERCDANTRAADGSKVTPFAYQMDALSANWPIHVAAYKEYLIYQVEWVTGRQGYIRWMLSGVPIFEIPASSIEEVPQDARKTNPKKIMLEEPMYLILNVAVSANWGSAPPNARKGGPCRGDGKNPEHNRICDAFPMTLKVDYLRLYQDLRNGSNMTVGCDPPTHPTKEWIQGHLDEYSDDQNPVKEVSGAAFCRKDDDCRAAGKAVMTMATGNCVKNRCVCKGGGSWMGPRCTMTMGDIEQTLEEGLNSKKNFGPRFEFAVGVAAFTVLLTIISSCFSINRDKKDAAEYKSRYAREGRGGGGGGAEIDRRSGAAMGIKGERTAYATNFV